MTARAFTPCATGSWSCWRTPSATRRWVEYCAAATVLGVRSSLSVPLHAQGHAPGALNLYADRPDAFGRKEVGRAQAFGAGASRALALAGRLTSAGELASQLRQALVSRTTIDQAIGVVMGQNRCDADAAFDMLRSASQHRNVKLRDVAARVLGSVQSRAPAGRRLTVRLARLDGAATRSAAAQPSTDVAAWAAPTGLDSGDPRWRR